VSQSNEWAIEWAAGRGFDAAASTGSLAYGRPTGTDDRQYRVAVFVDS